MNPQSDTFWGGPPETRVPARAGNEKSVKKTRFFRTWEIHTHIGAHFFGSPNARFYGDQAIGSKKLPKTVWGSP